MGMGFRNGIRAGVLGVAVATLGAVLLPLAFGAPVALASCAANATMCVELDRNHGRPGERIGATVVTTCADLDSIQILLVDPAGANIPLTPDADGGANRYTFVVPELLARHYRALAACGGLEAWEIAGGFDILPAPDTSTLASPPRQAPDPDPARIAAHALALAGLLGGLASWRRLGRRAER
jgi:hypothetical protein